MKLPDELLDEQFASQLVRGVIIRFQFGGFLDTKKLGPGPKFAVVLNRPDVSDPVYCALATSKVLAYNKTKQFDAVILRIKAGEYPCFPLETVIPFRDDPTQVSRTKLRQQFGIGAMSIECQLTDAHLQAINAMINGSPYIQPRFKQFILPPA